MQLVYSLTHLRVQNSDLISKKATNSYISQEIHFLFIWHRAQLYTPLVNLQTVYPSPLILLLVSVPFKIIKENNFPRSSSNLKQL